MAEIKRAQFRAPTQLSAAAIKELDPVLVGSNILLSYGAVDIARSCQDHAAKTHDILAEAISKDMAEMHRAEMNLNRLAVLGTSNTAQ